MFDLVVAGSPHLENCLETGSLSTTTTMAAATATTYWTMSAQLLYIDIMWDLKLQILFIQALNATI